GSDHAADASQAQQVLVQLVPGSDRIHTINAQVKTARLATLHRVATGDGVGQLVDQQVLCSRLIGSAAFALGKLHILLVKPPAHLRRAALVDDGRGDQIRSVHLAGGKHRLHEAATNVGGGHL